MLPVRSEITLRPLGSLQNKRSLTVVLMAVQPRLAADVDPAGCSGTGPLGLAVLPLLGLEESSSWEGSSSSPLFPRAFIINCVFKKKKLENVGKSPSTNCIPSRRKDVVGWRERTCSSEPPGKGHHQRGPRAEDSFRGAGTGQAAERLWAVDQASPCKARPRLIELQKAEAQC